MTTAVLTNIEWKELPTKSGKTSTGFELTFEDGSSKRIFDLSLKKHPNAKAGLTKLQKTKLPVTVDMTFVKDGDYQVLDAIVETTETVIVNTSVESNKKSVSKPGKTFVSDVDRQASIERQAALHDAVALICARISKVDVDIEMLQVAKDVKIIARELIKFHQEV